MLLIWLRTLTRFHFAFPFSFSLPFFSFPHSHTAAPSVTKLAEDVTVAPLLPGSLDGHLQDASEDILSGRLTGTGSTRRSRLGVPISSDGHPSQADSRILKAKDAASSSICLSPSLVLLILACLLR